jgi:hypothetical protein
MEDEKFVNHFWFGRLKGTDLSDGLGVDGRILLKQKLGKHDLDWIHMA